ASTLGLEAVPRGDAPVPAPGLLQRAVLRLAVAPGEAEALLVALGPLEVVEQRPGVVAAHVRARLDRARERLEVAAVVVDAALVADPAVRPRPIEAAAAVLGDLDPRPVEVARDAHDHVVERV